MERQIAEKMEDVRKDHYVRYEFARDTLKQLTTNYILDCGCGIGYGSYLLSELNNEDGNPVTIDSVDNSERAAWYQNEYFRKPNVTFHCTNFEVAPYKEWYDAVVCFEFLEHVPNPYDAVEIFGDRSPMLICSVPNEEVRPHKQEPVNPHHFRHFTPSDFVDLIQYGGYSNIKLYNQKNGSDPTIREGTDGKFMIAVATKME